MINIFQLFKFLSIVLKSWQEEIFTVQHATFIINIDKQILNHKHAMTSSKMSV